MDELHIRRQLYTDPQHLPEDTQSQVDSDVKLQQLQRELVQLDSFMQRTMQVEMPANLTTRLLALPDADQPHENAKSGQVQRRWWQYSIAASMLPAILWLSYWWSAPHSQWIGEQALDHLYHELPSLQITQLVNDNEVSALLSGLGAKFGNHALKVQYARMCTFDGVDSLHLVVQIKGQPVTVFVLPDRHGLKSSPRFADDRFHGESMQIAGREVVFIAEKPTLLAEAQIEVAQNLLFQS